MPTTQMRTPEMDVSKIDIVEDFNSRQDFDEEKLARLAETIKADGLVQPVSIRLTKGGRAELVAGERRFRAAKRAGLKTVPITVATANPRATAFIENHHREDLNPIETALDLRAFAAEFGLKTNKQIAARGKQEAPWVGEHLRLLKLPAEVQRYIAAGDVPIAAQSRLQKIADTSPEVAAFLCEVAKRMGISRGGFNDRFVDIFSAAGEAEIEGRPTMIRTPRFVLSDVITDPERHAQLADTINSALPPYSQREDPGVELGDTELDAARAAGCLVEYRFERNGYSTTISYITDTELLADLIERVVDRIEQERVVRIKADEDAETERKVTQKQLREDRKKTGEETPQAKAKKRKAIARSFNDNLGRTLLRKRTVSRRKKYALARAQAIACQLISDNPKLAGRGLRLVSGQLQELEVKSLKSGGQRMKVTYADAEQSTAELMRRAMGATDPLEVIEVIAEALLAALVTDADEVSSKDWIGWYSPIEGQLKKILGAEIKEVRPRRTRKAV